MAIHNVLEDLVIGIVDELCDEREAAENPDDCLATECREDVICYVLNRVQQRYVSSSRGLARARDEIRADRQLAVDVLSLAHEGLSRVTTVRRSYYNADGMNEQREGAYFTFPVIEGRVLNGVTFAPISDVEISLLRGGELVEMMDARWSNPYATVSAAPGGFLFWPKPIPADSAGEHADFDFAIATDDRRFEPYRHVFTLSARSALLHEVRMDSDLALPDLFLVPA